MTIREMLENIERDTLAPRAARSAETRGRDRDEPEDDLRPSSFTANHFAASNTKRRCSSPLKAITTARDSRTCSK
jgi:hypothetical protein